MDLVAFQNWIEQNPIPAFISILILNLFIFTIARSILARGLIYVSGRTETIIDDIIVKNLRPYRLAWLAPLIVIFSAASLLPEYAVAIEKVSLFLTLWVISFTLNSIITSINEIYERSPRNSGVSIQGYLDLVKILVILVSIILGISLLTGESPLVLLTGLGALTAVLLLIFRDTILSLLASIQISSHDLVKEGDWITIPSFNADGDVINLSLHSIKIQNFDKTISVVPTNKLLDVAYQNWRGMQESGGRRIKRSIHIDLSSIKYCDEEMILRFQTIDLLKDYMERKLQEIEAHNKSINGSSINGRQLTNVGTFRAYMEAYLRNLDTIHHHGMTFLIRQLASGPTGLPLEVYVFTKTVDWVVYEGIQADIFDHLLAALASFNLRVFQQPTGADFAQALR